MTRLKKELYNRNIIWDENEYNIIMMGPEHDNCAKLVDITNDFIITVFYSAVLDPELNVYDRHTFQLLAKQNLYPDYMSFIPGNKWGSYMNFEA